VGAAWMRQARDRQRRYRGDEGRRFGDAHDEAKQAYAEWFKQLPWDWFATFTLVLGARESAAFAWRSLSRWSGMMHNESGRQLRQVAALEYQRRGTAHLHNLIHGVRAGADPFHAMQLWEAASGGGFARIYPYQPEGGAADYCAKYVTKDMELRLIGPWPPHRGPQLF
jgi:hypothetical protein